jgi:hypothetical protein
MPHDLVRAPQLSLFVSDTAASPEALARYEGLRPALTGERSLLHYALKKCLGIRPPPS